MRRFLALSVRAAAAAAALALAGCRPAPSGPVEVSAIGPPAELVNPNLQAMPPASAFLIEAAAQGLVRFDRAGEIEPALAQSWIVSDDGLRYTFRLRRTHWSNGERVTAAQVAARLRAALSRASRNPMKNVLGAVADVTAMTDEVLEITLLGPRPYFLQLLAQPELAVIDEGRGTGPFRILSTGPRIVRLAPPRGTDEEEADEEVETDADILLRGERAAMAVARFREGKADLVTGGTAADLFVALAAEPGASLIFDPVAGLFGLRFASAEGPLADPAFRRALAMSVDREGLAAALRAPGLEPRGTLVSPGSHELPAPAQPDWAAQPLAMRRELAARAVAGLDLDGPPRLRVAIGDAPGLRVVFAFLKRDWGAIGVELERVAPDAAQAELRLVDDVAPALLASWYLRRFACDSSPVCDEAADAALQAARIAATPAERQAALAEADRILTGLTPFVPLTQPVRWSLVSARLTGFRPNMFARHPASELIAGRE